MDEFQEAIKSELLSRIRQYGETQLDVILFQYRTRQDPRSGEVYIEKLLPLGGYRPAGNIKRYPPEIQKIALAMREKLSKGEGRAAGRGRYYKVEDLKAQIETRKKDDRKKQKGKKPKPAPAPKLVVASKSDLQKQKETYEKQILSGHATPEVLEGYMARVQALANQQADIAKKTLQDLTDKDVGELSTLMDSLGYTVTKKQLKQDSTKTKGPTWNQLAKLAKDKGIPIREKVKGRQKTLTVKQLMHRLGM